MDSKPCAEVLRKREKMIDEKRALIVFAVVEFFVIAFVVYMMQTSKL